MHLLKNKRRSKKRSSKWLIGPLMTIIASSLSFNPSALNSRSKRSAVEKGKYFTIEKYNDKKLFYWTPFLIRNIKLSSSKKITSFKILVAYDKDVDSDNLGFKINDINSTLRNKATILDSRNIEFRGLLENDRIKFSFIVYQLKNETNELAKVSFDFLPSQIIPSNKIIELGGKEKDHLYESPYNLGPTSWKKEDARPVFKINDPSIFSKVDFWISYESNGIRTPLQKVFFNEDPVDKEENIYALKNGLKGQTQYTLLLKPKHNTNYFFSEGVPELTEKFKTKPKISEWERKVDIPKIIEKTITKKKPTTSTTGDGEISFKIENYDPNKAKAIVSQTHKLNGKWNSKAKIEKSDREGFWIIKNLRSKEKIRLEFALINPAKNRFDKRGQLWKSRSHFNPEPTNFKAEEQTKKGIKKPEIQSPLEIEKPPSTKEAKNGKIQIKVLNFENENMNLSVRSISKTTKTIEVKQELEKSDKFGEFFSFTNLSNSEKIIVTISLKLGKTWTDGTREPIEEEFTMKPTNVEGIEIPNIVDKEWKKAKTASSKDGQVILEISDYDQQDMDISFSNKQLALEPYSDKWIIRGLKSEQKITIYATPRIDKFWKDGKQIRRIIAQKITMPKTEYKGLKKSISILRNLEDDKAPRIVISKDGIMGLRFDDKNSDADIKSLWENAFWRIDAINSPDAKLVGNGLPSNKNLIIRNLASGAKVQLHIKPKPGHYWDDGTNQELSFGVHEAPSTNVLGITQPIIISQEPILIPSTKTSNDGVVKIFLENFNSKKMVLKASHGNVELYNERTKSIKINNISSGQTIEFTISPKPTYLWFIGEDITNQFTMPQVIEFPKNPIVTKEDPKELGGNGKIIISKFRNIEGAKFQYQDSITKQWNDANESGNDLVGKNGFKVIFRWKLLDEKKYKWINRELIAPAPDSLQLKNPGVVVVPKIDISINQISVPFGTGKISVSSFDKPNGVDLYYQTSEDPANWKQVNSLGQTWRKKNGFKIEFKWKLEPNFVWDISQMQPTPIEQSEITLLDPIDNKPPQWRKVNQLEDISSIRKDDSSNYVVNVKKLYGTKITKTQIYNWFKTYDNFPGAKIIDPVSEGEIEFLGQDHYLKLRSRDLVGNTSTLKINLVTKYRVIDLSNIEALKITFENSFSGEGQIATYNLSSKESAIPRITFQDSKTKTRINLLAKKIYATYRVVDFDGNPIQWEDSKNNKHSSWSSADIESPNIFGRFYPTNLLNNHKIQVKFLPQSGYKFVNESQIFEFLVSGLFEEIDKKIIVEPKYTFEGADGSGTIALKLESNADQLNEKVNYLVQIWRPYLPHNAPKNKMGVDQKGTPIYGIELFLPHPGKSSMNDPKNWQLVAGIANSFSKWDLNSNQIRALWRLTRLASKINSTNDSEIRPSLLQPSKIKTLSNFYWVRALPKAKGKWRFKLNRQQNIKIVNQYPQRFLKQIDLTGNLFSDLAQVNNLSIAPKIDISSESFKLNFLPSLDNAYKYEGDLRVIPSYIPQVQNGDRFEWKYKLIGSSGKIEHDWAREIDISKIKDNSIIKVGYKAIEPYTINELFAKMERDFVVKGLKRKIDASNVPQPTIIFKGNVGQGYISNLVEYNPEKQPYERVDGKLPHPKTSDLDSRSLKWQYRLFSSNPSSWPKEEIEETKWLDEAPTNLNTNSYVQVRVAPTNELRDGVEPQVYSIDPTTKSSFVQVNGLEINVNALKEISFEILGNRNQNIIEITGSQNDEIARTNSKLLTFEAWSENKKQWEPLSAFKNKLNNGMTLSFRAYASNAHLAKLPNIVSDGEIKEISGKKYLHLNSWKDIQIKGLKSIIYFRDLEPNLHKFIAMKETPWKRFLNAQNEKKVVSGWAKLQGPIYKESDLKRSFYYDQDGNSQSAINQVETQYQLLKFNPKTNTVIAQGWSVIAPTNLVNGDEIQVRLVPRDSSNFELDWERELTIKVENLYEPNLAKVASLPTLVFSGPDGNGVASLTTELSKLYEYGYRVYDKNLKPRGLWAKVLPTKLKNGYFVKSRVIIKNDDLENPQSKHIDSKFQLVDSLITSQESLKGIDLSPFTKAKITGRINYKATISFDFVIVKKLKDRNFRVEYLVKNKRKKNSSQFLDVPKNLANGDHLTIKLINKQTGYKHNLSDLDAKFKGLSVNGLVNEEAHSKSLSKAIWIPLILLTSGILLGIPIYAIRRKRKLSI